LSSFHTLDGVLDSEVGGFLCWPVFDRGVAEERVCQLRGLGVEGVALGGRHAVGGLPILGKGHSAVVLRALWRGLEVALKVRRTDADRVSMEREAGLLAHANRWGVGPRLHCYSRDFLVMELVEGPYLGEWVEGHLGEGALVRRVLAGVLGVARRLDLAGLDHGELNRVKRHFIVSTRGPRVIDFESASLQRRPKNVTATTQSLFLNHRFATTLAQAIPLPPREALIEALRAYRRNPTEEAFQALLEVCGLADYTPGFSLE